MKDWEILVLKNLPKEELRSYLQSCEEELRKVLFALSNASGRAKELRKKERALQTFRLKLLEALGEGGER